MVDKINFLCPYTAEDHFWTSNTIVLVKKLYLPKILKKKITKGAVADLLLLLYWEYVGILHHCLVYQLLSSEQKSPMKCYRCCLPKKYWLFTAFLGGHSLSYHSKNHNERQHESWVAQLPSGWCSTSISSKTKYLRDTFYP